MAELLLYNRTDIDSNLTKYDIGDVVAIKPDGHEWGRDELNTDKFLILAIPDTTAENLQFFLDSLEDENDLDEDGDPRFIKKREWKIDRFLLPLGLRRQLEAGKLTANRNAIENIFTRKPLPPTPVILKK